MQLYVSESRRGGKGTFAKSLIKNGEYIRALSGSVMTIDEMWKRIANEKEGYNDPLQIDQDLVIDLDEPSRLINHSCEPNAGVRGMNELYAICDIKPDEEITYDYSTTSSLKKPPYFFSMACICGEKNCRNIINNVASIPADQIEKYRRLNALPDYILKELNLS